jgi:hypothetical protein
MDAYPETRETPPEFQARLTALFGTNEWGDPHFKIVWGQSQLIRIGNLWSDKYGNERLEYRDRYQCHGMPCWVIMRWKAPVEYGTPEMYYANTFDAFTGLYITGEYPWRGRYESVQPLISKEFVDGKLVIEHFPLSHYLIDMLIPMMLAFQELSEEQKEAARQATAAAEERKATEEIADRMAENLPSFWGPVSFGAGGSRCSVLDKKMDAIQKVWDRLSRRGQRPRFRRAMTIGNRPRIIGYN